MQADDAFNFVKSKRSHVLLWTNQRKRVEEYAHHAEHLDPNSLTDAS